MAHVKVISKNNERVAVNLDNLNLFRVDPTEARIISLYGEGRDIPAIASALSLPEDQCRAVINTFCTLPGGVQMVTGELGDLDELLLMVATDCNMHCGYCYGDGGTYHRGRALMNEETAVKAIEAASSLGDISVITLFGGEPLLNFELIKTIVEKTEGTMKCGIITNGTLMNEEIAEFIKTHSIPITVSIDGPQEVHDSGRRYRDGRGTHKKVVETLRVLNRAGIPFAVEATFTHKAVEQGYRATQVLEYLYQFTPTINIAPATFGGTPPEYQLSLEELKDFRIQCIDFAFDKIQKGEPINIYDLTALISRIASKDRFAPQTFCSFHARRFAVFPSGDAYPCYLAAKEEYRYGNVFDPDFVETFPEKSRKILPHLCRDRLVHSPWFIPLLTNICVSTLVEEGDRFRLNETLATSHNETMEHLLYRMGQVRNWGAFFATL